MAEPVIDIDSFSKSYRTWRNSVDAVVGLSLTVERGSVVAFVGPNGAGKTTTIYAMLGLLTPTQGTISLFGKPAGSVEARRRLGFLSEIFYTYPFCTAVTALRFYGQLSGIAATDLDQRIPSALARLGLTDAKDRKVSSFSKGMVQRLGLAQALLHAPELLILDEPTTGLDPEGRKLVTDLILEEKARGTTIFLSSHILSDVERICDRVLMIRRGSVVLSEAMNMLGRGEGQWEIEVLGARADLAASLAGTDSRILRQTADTTLIGCPRERKNDLLRTLLAAEVEIGEVRRGRKSLEDLYMELVGAASNG